MRSLMYARCDQQIDGLLCSDLFCGERIRTMSVFMLRPHSPRVVTRAKDFCLLWKPLPWPVYLHRAFLSTNSASQPRPKVPDGKASSTQQPAGPSKSIQRFEKLLNRSPKFLRNWIQPIANKPLSHITSFLILHEVRATFQFLNNCRLQP